MPNKASVDAVAIQRAAREEKCCMELDGNGLVRFYSLEPTRVGQELHVADGDKLSLSHIPALLDCMYGLDGHEVVRKRGMNFSFLNHEDRELSIKCFAKFGVIAQVIDHDGAGFQVIGPPGEEHLEYVDPVESDFQDEYVSAGEGC